MFAFHELLDRVRRGVTAIAGTVELHYQLTAHTVEQLDRIETKVDFIMAREQVSWDNYQANVGQLVAGYKASQAENRVLREQIETLSKSVQDRVNNAVADALAADDEHDAVRIDAANNALPIIENGAPIPPRPADATPQTTESGAHDEIGPDGFPVTVGPDDDSVADPDDATNDEDRETTSDPAVNSGDDSGQTATTGDHSSANADQSTSSAN